MIWNKDNTNPGEIIAFPTLSGDFKDVQIISCLDGKWFKISLLDGLMSEPEDPQSFLVHLNNHLAVPIAKVFGTQSRDLTLPENRANLPIVTILNMRHSK